MMLIKKRNLESIIMMLFFLVLVFLYLTPSAWGDEPKILTLQECLEIAEANHPELAGAEAQTAAERGRLKQTGVPDRVKITGNVTASRSGTDDKGENASYSVGGTASLKVYDANRTKYDISAQRNTLAATEETFNNVRLKVRSNVKSSYITLLLNKAIYEQRLESVRAFERHLEQAKGFFEVGTKPRFDVTKAEVDLGNAQLALLQAESDVKLANTSLLNAMGISGSEAFEIKGISWDIPIEVEQDAEKLALENRPDYKAAELKTSAGSYSIRSAARGNSPSVSVTSGYSAGGDDFFSLDKGWNVGLSVSIPIVDGGAANAALEIAMAQAKSLNAVQETLKQNIQLEVRKAVLAVRTARERIRITELTVKQAKENYELAEGRYQMGVSNALEVTDALLALTNANLSAYQAIYGLQSALVNLEKSIGTEYYTPDKGGNSI